MSTSFEQRLAEEKVKDMESKERIAAHWKYQNFFKTHVKLADGWHPIGTCGTKRVSAPVRPR